MSDAQTGWDELPEGLKKNVVKFGKLMAGMEQIRQRGLLFKSLIAAWDGKEEVEVHRPLAEMSDEGLDKAVIILEKVTKAVDNMRHVRATQKGAKEGEGGS